jgi:hypothetical protein
MPSILDLPEPIRSQALAEMDMTAEEYAAYDAGLVAADAEAERMIAAGEMERATDMHYDDDLPGVRVVDLSKERERHA